MAVQPIPEGYHTITPHITVRGAAEAIAFYTQAFGAVELFRLPDEKGVIQHAEIRIGDSVIMLNDEIPDQGALSPLSVNGCPSTFMIYSEDTDASMARAQQAGATVTMPAQDMFWGDRYGRVTDPYGYHWAFSTHQEDVSPEEIMERMKQQGNI